MVKETWLGIPKYVFIIVFLIMIGVIVLVFIFHKKKVSDADQKADQKAKNETWETLPNSNCNVDDAFFRRADRSLISYQNLEYAKQGCLYRDSCKYIIPAWTGKVFWIANDACTGNIEKKPGQNMYRRT